MQKQKQSLINSIKLALIMALPFFVLVIFGWFLIAIKFSYYKEVLGFGFQTVILVSLTILISRKSAFFLSLLLSILAFIKLSFYHNFGVKISASALFVIFETDTTESSDFLSNYFNGTVILLAILFLFVIPFMLNKLLKRKEKTKHFKFIKLLTIFAISASVFIIYKRFKQENVIYTAVSSYSEFGELQKQLKSDLAKPKSDVVEVIKKEDFPETHVVIIGESTSSWHMQLYGYNRETNPRLTEIKDELLVFDSVIAPNVHTIIALDKILTFSDFNTPNKKNNASIVQLANQAGFDTYWISNQRPVGMHERISSIIGTGAKETYFVATDNSNDVIYDEALLKPLDNVLAKSAKKKLVFIHLIGTHSRYNSRYPDGFNYYKTPKEDLKFVSDRAIDYTNYYDNATRYNDSIVREIIEKVRQQETNSYVMYFSDHGDEVFDTMDFVAHNEYWATRPMYEVPFIVWLSEDFKLKNESSKDFKNFTKRPYILEDFIHSFSDLSGIQFKTLDSTKSIFNKTFVKKQRLIKDGIDYDLRNKISDN